MKDLGLNQNKIMNSFKSNGIISIIYYVPYTPINLGIYQYI